ncbi:uncharacterized protein LAESUDRAFT_760833 [Laetiporus sulphureus 93-53]|uniref:Rho-GAP domain-containing protein n=1 Tax=Laetiporus sulphureus 93-53 TaxID=1314785 RepID=A0A165DG29_9APHY|nr:uncharacterized protein LAESUDRAFT_760833 [Laetiporus sulphureus 93-53]KZT04815.1 hypothetical protein LAESUDRAFT_760833 [Laetiporus sulphureus 93-53]
MPVNSRPRRASCATEAAQLAVEARMPAVRFSVKDALPQMTERPQGERGSVAGKEQEEGRSPHTSRGILHRTQLNLDPYAAPSPTRFAETYASPSTSRSITPRQRDDKRLSVPNVPSVNSYPRFSSLPSSRLSDAYSEPLSPLHADYQQGGHVPSSPTSSFARIPLSSRSQLANPKLSMVHSIDTEYDRLARACGQLPPGVASSRHRAASWAPAAPGQVAEEDPLNEGSNGGARHRRARSMRVAGHTPYVLDDPGPSSLLWQHDMREGTLQPRDAPPFQQPEPRGVLLSLSRLLQLGRQDVNDYIEMDEFLERKHEEERERQVWLDRRAKAAEMGKERAPGIFGASLRDAVSRSPANTIMGGRKHEIPTVVHTCVEELYRTGIYQTDLFRALPNRANLVELVRAFDTNANVSRSPLLRHAPMADICAVLTSYINSLPEPLFDRTMHDALWTWCVQAEMSEDEKKKDALDAQDAQDAKSESESFVRAPARMFRRRSLSEPKTPPSLSQSANTKTPQEQEREDADKERRCIAVTRHILQLIPPESLSLLAYLFAFFTQIPLCPDNGLSYEDIARIFAHRLLGGPSKNAARSLMMWLLNRWSAISENLLGGDENDSDALQSNLVRRMSSGRLRRLSLPPQWSEGMPTHDDSLQVPSYATPLGRPYSSSVSSDTSSSTAESMESEDEPSARGTLAYDMQDMRERKAAYEAHLGLPDDDYYGKSSVQEHGFVTTPLSDDYDFLKFYDYFRKEKNAFESDSESVCSTDMDEPSAPSAGQTPHVSNDFPSAVASSNHKLSSALQRISELESELQRTRDSRTSLEDVLLPDSTTTGMPQKLRNELSDESPEEIEYMRRETAQKQLEVALNERDDAKKLLQGFKQLIDEALLQ